MNVQVAIVEEATTALVVPTYGELEERLKEIVGRLKGLAADQVRLKRPVEEMWIEDLRQFHGRYDSKVEGELKEAKKSLAFVRVTRKKTNSWKGRLESLIYPTDDRNYSVGPTPVPSLTEASKEVVKQAMALVEQANEQQRQAEAAQQAGDDPAAAQAAQQAAETAGQADQIGQQAKTLAAEIAEAKKRAAAMQQEMDDQLVECGYAAEGRDSLLDLCRLGSAIMKGPLAAAASRGKWQPKTEGSGYAYTVEQNPRPIFKRVDPWAYFPDMSARKKGEEEFEFERHLWTRKDLRRMVRENGFNADAVRRLLAETVNGVSMTDAGLTYLAELRSIDGTTELLKGRYVGWEYHGPLDCDEIVTMLHAMGDHDTAFEYAANDDPLRELKVICYFCNGELLKISPEFPLDSQESLYSLVPFEQAEGSMFGYGIPRISSDSQRAVNAGWRMMLDNGGMSAGPQIVVDMDAIEPQDGSWDLRARKVWKKKKGPGITEAFQTFDIPNNAQELMMIVTTARQFMDDETALPVQSEGEITEGPDVTATASNIMALGFNVTFRTVVKAWDDGMIVPSMRRLYDWNMQFSDREEIKGDMGVEARGTSVLMVREIQTQILMQVVQGHTIHPVLGKMIQPYTAYEKFLQSMMIPPDEIMVTKEAYDKALATEAENPQPDPAIIVAQTSLEKAKLETQTSLQVAEMNRQTELIKLAEMKNMNVDKLTAMLAIKQIDADVKTQTNAQNVQSKERTFAAELGAEEVNRERAEARGEEPAGSGGFISAGSAKP